MRRLHVCFKGDVQGVGFRFTARYIAARLGIKGWVRNLPNGDVECVAEADEDTLEEFLKRIKDDMKVYIRTSDDRWSRASGEFKGFDIS